MACGHGVQAGVILTDHHANAPSHDPIAVTAAVYTMRIEVAFHQFLESTCVDDFEFCVRCLKHVPKRSLHARDTFGGNTLEQTDVEAHLLKRAKKHRMQCQLLHCLKEAKCLFRSLMLDWYSHPTRRSVGTENNSG